MLKSDLNRRSLLVHLTAWTASACGSGLLTACGTRSGASASSPAAPLASEALPRAAAVATPGPAAGISLSSDTERLNFALNFEYLVAQFYAYASSGTGLPANLLTGVGLQGSAIGARIATLSDASVAKAAVDLAVDKSDHVVALRAQLGSAAAAMPTLDLAASAGSAFRVLSRTSGVSTTSAFDPYANESQFLLAAMTLEYALAANYRTLLESATSPSATKVLGDILARSIYHGGLVRTLLDARAATDTQLSADASAICTFLAQIDGTSAGDQTLVGADSGTANVSDAAGRPLPFMRVPGQVLRIAFLNSPGTSGGFFPNGLNGLG